MNKLNKNNIDTFFHCRICVNELNNSTSTKDLSMIDPQSSGYSPRTYARMEVGFTKHGFQVWCIRHDQNIVHIDFKGQEVDTDITSDMDSEDANTWLAKGMEFIKLKNYDEGIRCFNEVIRFEDVDHYALCGAWNEKGLAYGVMQKYDDSISCYDEIIKIDPTYVNAWSNKAAALESINKHKDAKLCFDKVDQLKQK